MIELDHIGIAVRSIAEAARPYVEGLGLQLAHIQEVPEQGVRVGFLPLGHTELELLEPLDSQSALNQTLDKRGEGVHHVCIRVADIRATMQRMKESGAQLLSAEPTLGAGGRLVCFVHPRSMHGVLLELCQAAAE